MAAVAWWSLVSSSGEPWPWIAGNRGGACSIENLDCGFAVQLVNVAAVAWWLALDDLGGGVVVAGEFQR